MDRVKVEKDTRASISRKLTSISKIGEKIYFEFYGYYPLKSQSVDMKKVKKLLELQKERVFELEEIISEIENEGENKWGM